MKKRLLLSITILLTAVIILLSSCGTDDTTPPEDTIITIAPVDATTESPTYTTAPQDTTVVDTTPVFDESNYDLYGGLVCKGSIKDILNTYRPDDRLGFVGIAGSDLVVRAFAIMQADWYENTEQELVQKGYSLKTPDFDTAKYDSAYFESKILLMIHITAPSNTVSYDVSVAKHDVNSFDAYVDIVKTASDATPKSNTKDHVYFLEIEKPNYPPVDFLIVHYNCTDKTADSAPSGNTPLDLRAGMACHGSMKEVLENINSLYDYMPGDAAAYGLGGVRGRYRLRTYAITQADWCEIPEYFHIQTPGFDASKYDEEFFKDNYLIMILMPVSDIDHAHSTYNVSLTGTEDTTACIDIEYIKYTGEHWTSWQDYRYLYFFEVKKASNPEYHMVEYNFYVK